MDTKVKQPGDDLDYDVNFSRWIPEGDVITDAEITLDVEGELVVGSYSIASPIVKVWLSGGVSGSTYKVTVTASTTGGRVKETEFRLRVKGI